MEESDKYYTRWRRLQSQYEKKIKTETTPPSKTVDEKSFKKLFKLPVLEIKKFDGKIKNWLPFWGQFEKIDKDQKIDAVDKLQYLAQAMTPESEVKTFVESFPPSDSSYKQCIEDLKERYAREDLLIQVYVRELLSIILNKEEKLNLTQLYDKLNAQLRALNTLGVTKNKYSAFLLPMVESALPIDILKVWERARPAKVEDELSSLINFLKREVEGEQRINMAQATLKHEEVIQESTAGCLVAGVSKDESKTTCIWCEKPYHSSLECFKVPNMSLEKRREHLKQKNACHLCLKPGHHAKTCKSYVKCVVCARRHSTVLCDQKVTNEKTEDTKSSISAHSQQKNSITLLQTAIVYVINGEKRQKVRAMIDSGSQRSYILKNVAQHLSLPATGKEVVSHELFGGRQVGAKTHNVYDLTVKSVNSAFEFNLSALDQDCICKNIPKYDKNDRAVNEMLVKHNIMLADVGVEEEIGLLIGADYSGLIMTDTFVNMGQLVAIKSKLGWFIQGKQATVTTTNNLAISLFCASDVTGFWSLELLGIKDPAASKSKLQAETDAVMSFEETVAVNQDGRYQVALPFKVGQEDLGSNKSLSKKRLESTTKRLVSMGKFSKYDEVLKGWCQDGIVEVVPEGLQQTQAHYLPHRGVIKDSNLTTKLRPVFDASACDKNNRSLNSYLNTDVNFLDKIPHLIIGFRKNEIGVTSDIAKAFLQISVRPSDRDYLRFLWWKDDTQTDVIEYRHCRVVFGLTASPFLLSATIAHHLNQITGRLAETAKILAKSFYVDNCITSLDSEEEMIKFISEAKEIMSLGKFNLRQWMTSEGLVNEIGSDINLVLGLKWNAVTDTLSCNIDNLPDYSTLGKVTKKDLMSLIHRIFDPIGFTCPATVTPRLILQETWRRNLSWDEQLPQDLDKEFRRWYEHINRLKDCKIPRRLTTATIVNSQLSLHMFCDASKVAYGACVFLRAEKEEKVSVQMIAAKSKIAPSENVTIPRLELLAALIGSRLLKEVKKSLGDELSEEHCWTDSGVTLFWITRDLPWNVFVYNRVKEIRENAKPSNWHHIPGTLNWADVASRGCTAERLLLLRWWEGPAWLRLKQDEWPKSCLTMGEGDARRELCTGDAVEVAAPRFDARRMVCAASVALVEGTKIFCYFSKYSKIIRMTAWMLRFARNARSEIKNTGDITYDEYEIAEKKLLKLIQSEEKDMIHEKSSNLTTYLDDDGLLRVKTKLLLADFPEATKLPILLPAKCVIVRRMVEQTHKNLQHAGANQLIAELRKRFWILGIRRLVKSVLAACIVCTRHGGRSTQVASAPLPLERLECGAPFEVAGVDLAGPLYLRSGDKCWIVLYTCAVYRCVHLELTKSLSAEAFMLTLRFFARRGRSRQLITDNGTNFTGTNNLLSRIDWAKVQSRSVIERVKWKFNTPSASWWRGFFERLIRIMKNLLKRILGSSRIEYDQMETILCECEAVMNGRPLTYVQDDQNNSLEPLTPSCFLQSTTVTDVTDLDMVDGKSLNLRLKYLQKLREDFKTRFKSEYLTALIQRGKETTANINVGDIVLIETDEKRIKWPLGRIIETFKGKDGLNRTAAVKTSMGVRLRPFQKLYPLEVSASDVSSKQPILPKTTRSGRAVNLPTNTVFYSSGLVATLFFVKIAFYWHRVVHKVEMIESKLPPLTSKVVTYCNTVVIFVVITATVEHIASLWYGLKVSRICDPANVLETYFTTNMPWVFDKFTYGLWKGLLGEIFNIQTTFMWSFNDVLIMVVSIYLTEHFQVHYDSLQNMILKQQFHLSEMRAQHVRIVRLVHILNNAVGVIVLTSFAENLFWICVQLYNSLNKNNTGHFNVRQHDRSGYNLEHTFYFFYSFAFLVLRTAAVALLAARIRTVSVKPLRLLYEVPMESYNFEVQRYIDQVKYTKVALSGLDFFNVTRRMILTLVGTIVTYELVLLQFGMGSASNKHS